MRSLPDCQKAHLYHVHIHINGRTHSFKICDAKNLQKQRVRGRTAACEGGAAEGLLEDLLENLKWLPVLDNLVREPELAGDGGGSSAGSTAASPPHKLNSFDNVSFIIHARMVCVCERWSSRVLCSQVLTLCKVTVSDYYEILLFNGITGENIKRHKPYMKNKRYFLST
jgi:hypothetical protein